MPGPHSPDHTVGTDGPPTPAESRPLSSPITDPPAARHPQRRPTALTPSGLSRAAATAGALSERAAVQRRLIIGRWWPSRWWPPLTAAIVYGVRTNGANTGAAFSDATAKTAIQGYLDALEHRDTERSPATRCAASTTPCGTDEPTRRWPSSAATRSASSSPRSR